MNESHPLQQPAYPSNSAQSLEQMQQELRDQRKLIDENHTMLRKIHRSMQIASVFAVVRLLLVLIPLILALIFLPPFIKQWTGIINEYQDVFSVQGTVPKGFDINKIQDLLQSSGLLER